MLSYKLLDSHASSHYSMLLMGFTVWLPVTGRVRSASLGTACIHACTLLFFLLATVLLNLQLPAASAVRHGPNLLHMGFLLSDAAYGWGDETSETCGCLVLMWCRILELHMQVYNKESSSHYCCGTVRCVHMRCLSYPLPRPHELAGRACTCLLLLQKEQK